MIVVAGGALKGHKIMRSHLAWILTALLLTASCSSRSVENFCETLATEGVKLRDSFLSAQQSEDPLDKFGALAAAPNDIAAILEKLEKVAPDEIQPDVAAMRDASRKIAEKAAPDSLDPTDLMGGVVGGVMTGLAVRKSEKRVGEYISDNCGTTLPS